MLQSNFTLKYQQWLFVVKQTKNIVKFHLFKFARLSVVRLWKQQFQKCSLDICIPIDSSQFLQIIPSQGRLHNLYNEFWGLSPHLKFCQNKVAWQNPD